jgi:hypothetical protein
LSSKSTHSVLEGVRRRTALSVRHTGCASVDWAHRCERPHVTVLVDAATLREEPGSPPALLDWKVPVCGETAKRLPCDASARLALIGDHGDGTIDVLHLGRSSRTTGKRQRLTLEIRDGGCLWPACGGHPKGCTPHHFAMWSAGGPTDYEIMGLNCP